MTISPALALASLVLALSPAPFARAHSFMVVHSSPTTWTVLDPAGVLRDPQTQHLTAWTVTVQANLTNGVPPQPGYVRTLSEYDCAERRLRWRSFVAYSRIGALVMKKDNAFPEWEPAESGEGNASLRVLCDGGGGGAVVSAGSIGQLVISLMQAWDPPGDLPHSPPVAGPPAKPAVRSKSPSHHPAH